MAADVTFMTDAGAAQPNITGVSTNLNTYSIDIENFSDRFGPLRSVCAPPSLCHATSHSLTPYTATMRCLW